jgi:hypothetical protein
MTIMVRDIIEGLEKEATSSGKRKRAILIDPYSLAALREELGLDIEQDLTNFHGLVIKVQEDESEVIRLI